MDTCGKVANVLDELGLETSGSVGTISSVELVLSHVSMGRDVIVLGSLVVRAKDTPRASEVTSNVLLSIAERVEAPTGTSARVDCVSNAGFVSWD